VPVVNTVTGPIEAGQLGWTMPHEHIVVAWDGTFLDSTLEVDWQKLEDDAAGALTRARESGIDSFIDMTTIEMGRDPALMKRLSEKSGLQIICCTGLFAEGYGIPQYFRELTEEEIAEIYVKEITEGIGDTGVQAGVIKVATGDRVVTQLEEKIVRAGARAHVATGAPVLTHTGRGGGGERQIELLTEGGVAPGKIVVGHSDVSADSKYHLRLLRKGVYVGFDRIGLKAFMPDEVRAGCIATLIRMGYTGQLTMSLDAHVEWCGRPQPLTEEREFTSLRDDFFPRLHQMGITEEEIESIMVDNIRALFS
jgi:phosphotriesterase-related protein